jgi:hypothetical protein
MKTKNSIFLLILILGIGLVSSCSDSYFDKYPSDSMQMETYLNSDSEVKNVLLDSYYSLRVMSENAIYINDICTDVAYDRKKNNATDYISLNECTWDATISFSDSIWVNGYKMINRCNNVLEHLNNVKNPDNKVQFEGEAKFFRAYAYFTLVRLFGPVPLTETVIKNYSDLYNYGRNSTDDIYTLIKSDLTNAINNLPESYSAVTDKGRVTKIAAYTMQAEMYMTLKDFSNAKKSLESVIAYANQNPSILGLEDDVLKIYDSKNPIGKEIILAAQFNNGATIVDNPLMRRCLPTVTPSNQPSYTYPDGTKSTISCSQGYSCLLMTWELYNTLKANPKDQRYKKLIYNGLYDTESVSKASDEVELTTDGYAKVPASLKYYDFNNQGLNTCESGCDNIIYRYADVLLMYAECLNELGDVNQAASYINKVRNRAGLDNTTATTKETMALAIENERLLELNFEGHRWYDLVRTGRITSVMENHFNHRTQGLSAVIQADDNGMVVKDCNSTTATSTAKWKWSNTSAAILFPIPYNQIQLMPSWQQNELY